MPHHETSSDVTPTALVEEALDLIENRALKRRAVPWERVRPATLEATRTCTTLGEAHDLIRGVLKQLGDNHSFLWPAEKRRRREQRDDTGMRLHPAEPVIIDVFADSPAAAHGLRPGDRIVAVNAQSTREGWRSLFLPALQAGSVLTVRRAAGGEDEVMVLETGFKQPNPPPGAFITPDGFGVIDLPGHMGEGDLPDGSSYAERAQRALHEQEQAGARGWVIDLRRNDGGNMWPMLAGLTPLLGVGDYGSFTGFFDGTRWLWRFDGDTLRCVCEGRHDQPTEIGVKGYRTLRRADAPVAVLSSRVTSSSGEGVMVAFLGRPNTRTFGLPTGGLATGNNRHTLMDDTWLLLTESAMTDRLGRTYPAGVVPEERLEVDWAALHTPADPVMERARQWLREQVG